MYQASDIENWKLSYEHIAPWSTTVRLQNLSKIAYTAAKLFLEDTKFSRNACNMAICSGEYSLLSKWFWHWSDQLKTSTSSDGGLGNMSNTNGSTNQWFDHTPVICWSVQGNKNVDCLELRRSKSCPAPVLMSPSISCLHACLLQTWERKTEIIISQRLLCLATLFLSCWVLCLEMNVFVKTLTGVLQKRSWCGKTSYQTTFNLQTTTSA